MQGPRGDNYSQAPAKLMVRKPGARDRLDIIARFRAHFSGTGRLPHFAGLQISDEQSRNRLPAMME